MYNFPLYLGAMSSQVGRNLARWRKKKGLSQREFAKKLGVSQPAIAYYEKEPTSIPIDKIQKICEILEIGPADIFDGERHKGNPKLSEWDIRLLKELALIKKLPEADRRSVTQHLSMALEKYGLKKPHWKARGATTGRQ